MWDVPFNQPTRLGNELELADRAFRNGQISGDGPFTQLVSELLEDELGIPRALVTTSCTHALEMAAILLNLAPGDEVILPSFTFTSTATAFVMRGAKPVFVDCRPDTLNIDESKIGDAIGERTKAIVVVHYAGIPCEMDTINGIADQHGIPVVEDAAHALFGKYRGRWLGTIGTFGTLSFHETKNFSCGEGGALLINEPGFVERAEIIREKGTNRSQFFRGEVDRYTWVDLGSSYLPSDLLSALLYGQLQARDDIQSRRAGIWNCYDNQLRKWADSQGITQPTVPLACQQAFHLYYILLPTPDARTAFIAHMRKRKILTVFHYQPLHASPMGRRIGGNKAECPVTEDIAERLVRFPLYYNMTDEQIRRVVEAALEFEV